MSYKPLIISLFLIPSLLIGALPATTAASGALSTQQRLELLTQIQQLLAQVSVLQKQLQALQSRSFISGTVIENREPYESKYYNFNYESIYFVDNGKLVNSSGAGVIKNTDQQLFDLFTAVVGDKTVSKSVDEWRIFYERKSYVGAYVELMTTTEAGPRDWIVGVNREGFNSNTVASFANLFIHEYAHVLLYDYPAFEKNYRTNFWSVADEANSLKVSKVSEERKFTLTQNYFENNQNRFVTDYATNNVDEDIAETFVYFVREGKPIATTVRNQKILAFYQEPDLVEVRTQIRINLKRLGVL